MNTSSKHARPTSAGTTDSSSSKQRYGNRRIKFPSLGRIKSTAPSFNLDISENENNNSSHLPFNVSLQPVNANLNIATSEEEKREEDSISAVDDNRAEAVAGSNMTMVRKVEEKVDAVDVAVKEMEGNMEAASGRINTLEKNTKSLNEKIGGKLMSVFGRIHQVEESTMGRHLTLNSKAKKIDMIDGKVGAIEGAVGAIEAKVVTIEGTVGAIEAKVVTMEGEISAIKGKSEGKIETIEGRIETMDGKVSTIEGKVETMEGKIDTMEGKFEPVEGKISDPFTDIPFTKHVESGRCDILIILFFQAG